jgi:hypothetical protein
VLARPRPLIRSGGYYVPAPRKNAPSIHAEQDEAVASVIFIH